MARNSAALLVETGICDAVASEFKAQATGRKISLSLLMLRLIVSAEDGQPYIHSCEAGHMFVCVRLIACACAHVHVCVRAPVLTGAPAR